MTIREDALAFFTEPNFTAWWKGRRDQLCAFRMKTCPLARFVQANGFPDAEVGGVNLYLHGERWGGLPLPQWARRQVWAFDFDLPPWLE